MGANLIKVFSIGTTVLSVVASLLVGIAEDKKMDAKISKAVAEALKNR